MLKGKQPVAMDDLLALTAGQVIKFLQTMLLMAGKDFLVVINEKILVL